jgi:hypothetical protein
MHIGLHLVFFRKSGVTGRESSLPQHLAPIAPRLSCFCSRAPRALSFSLSVRRSSRFRSLPPTTMAPPQSIHVLDPLPWHRSMVTEFALHELENGGQLAPNVDGQPRHGSSRRRRIGSPIRRTATSSASSATMSVASRRRRAASCAGCATTMAWSCTTSPRTQSHRRLPSSASARGSWGSQRTGISGSISSARSCTRSPRVSHRCTVRCALAGCRFRCGSRAGNFTFPTQ